MQLITLLDQLEQQGQLSQLYQAGALNLATLNHREAYHYYQSLLATPRYHDQRTRAVEATAEYCRMQCSTVYRAIKSMQQVVGPDAV